jgi:hypothetical protein
VILGSIHRCDSLSHYRTPEKLAHMVIRLAAIATYLIGPFKETTNSQSILNNEETIMKNFTYRNAMFAVIGLNFIQVFATADYFNIWSLAGEATGQSLVFILIIAIIAVVHKIIASIYNKLKGAV